MARLKPCPSSRAFSHLQRRKWTNLRFVFYANSKPLINPAIYGAAEAKAVPQRQQPRIAEKVDGAAEAMPSLRQFFSAACFNR
jgi:hypothetical protein